VATDQVSDLRVAEEFRPELHVDKLMVRVDHLFERVIVQVVDNLAVLAVQIGPDAECPLLDVIAHAFDHRVAQEGAEQARVGVVAELEQEGLVELEGPRELTLYLVDTVEPLQEHGTPLVDVVVAVGVAVALCELVAEH